MQKQINIVYVLISKHNDYYIDQLYISLLSLRKYEPTMPVIVLTDNNTECVINNYNKNITKLVSNILVVDIPKKFIQSTTLSSRYLKTTMRRYIDGDFLYIDCDTIIYGPIDVCELYNNGHIGAVLDTHCDFKKNPYRQLCIKQGHLLDWSIEDETYYFNSGVLFVDSSTFSNSFFEKWHSIWSDGVEHNVKMDQPSFAKTNYLLGHGVSPINDKYNCQLKHGIKYLNKVVILHYLYNRHIYSTDNIFLLLDDTFYDRFRNSDSIPTELERCIQSPFYGILTETKIVNSNNYNDFEDSLITELVKHHNTMEYNIIKFIYRLLCHFNNKE